LQNAFDSLDSQLTTPEQDEFTRKKKFTEIFNRIKADRLRTYGDNPAEKYYADMDVENPTEAAVFGVRSIAIIEDPIGKFSLFFINS
jgi:hypothetical protein